MIWGSCRVVTVYIFYHILSHPNLPLDPRLGRSFCQQRPRSPEECLKWDEAVNFYIDPIVNPYVHDIYLEQRSTYQPSH